MSRIPDYDKMRRKLASYYADNLGEQDVYDMVMHGFQGFEHESNEEILETFVNMFDAKDIPKVKIDRGDDNPLWPHYIKEDD
tara:strand:- start:249 stop:494 length:246 start_codon:yes stop_codon:yes gene_type:complete